MGKGSSPAPQPSSQTVTNTSIPEYARPYVENMLGKSEALTDINANPYQAYGGQRIQGFTPMQEQAFQGVGNMQVAPEIAAGSNLAAAAGLGSMGAGSNYMRMATDPRATQAFMSPYMQNVVDTQKAEAIRDYEKGLGALNARAVGSGAFGGTRAALERAEAGRNLGTQLGNIQAQGTQNAFQAAQQAQQYGAGLGLQGMGQGLQAASTLGQLGQTGYGQQMGILGEQQKVGAVQQAQGQQALDTAYQDFLKQKNYPYTQLAFMSDMLRGLPLSQTAQSVYSAPPNVASQLGGLGMAGLGIYGMSGGFKAAEGGAVPGYKEGGEIGYSFGGDIRSITDEKQLVDMLDSPGLSPMEVAMIEDRIQEIRRFKMNPQAISMIGGRSGVGSISTGDMVPEDTVMAKEGGIMSFAGNKGSFVKPEGYDERRQKLETLRDALGESLMDNKSWQESDKAIQELNKTIGEDKEALPYRAMAATGFGMAEGNPDPALRGNFLSNLSYGGGRGLNEYSKGLGQIAADRKLALQQGVEAEKAKYARKAQLYGQLSGTIGQMDTKELSGIQAALLRDQNALYKDRDLRDRAQKAHEKLFNNALNKLTAASKDLTSPFYKRYKGNANLIEEDAKRIAKEQLNAEYRDVLDFPEADISKVVPEPPKPGATSSQKTGPVTVDVPGGKRYTFPTQEKADEFKRKAGLS